MLETFYTIQKANGIGGEACAAPLMPQQEPWLPQNPDKCQVVWKCGEVGRKEVFQGRVKAEWEESSSSKSYPVSGSDVQHKASLLQQAQFWEAPFHPGVLFRVSTLPWTMLTACSDPTENPAVTVQRCHSFARQDWAVMHMDTKLN